MPSGSGEDLPPAATSQEEHTVRGPLTVIVEGTQRRPGAEVVERTIEETLRRHGLEYRIAMTDSERDATQVARDALAAGDRFLVAFGDDPTVSDVVNGMLNHDMPGAAEAVLGVLPRPGCDFTKTFGLPDDPQRAARHLTGEGLYPIDVGRLTLTGGDGRQRVRYFVNLVQAGLGAAVTARAGGSPERVGRGKYFSAYWFTMATYRRPAVEVRTGSKEFEGTATSVVIGNCQFSRGVRLSPRSFPGDGFLDVLVYKGPKSDSFTKLPKMWSGDQVPDENIVEYRAKKIHLEADRPLPVEADGRVVGSTPATFELIPQAIRLKI